MDSVKTKHRSPGLAGPITGAKKDFRSSTGCSNSVRAMWEWISWSRSACVQRTLYGVEYYMLVFFVLTERATIVSSAGSLSVALFCCSIVLSRLYLVVSCVSCLLSSYSGRHVNTATHNFDFTLRFLQAPRPPNRLHELHFHGWNSSFRSCWTLSFQGNL